jgi:hypothetical protein
MPPEQNALRKLNYFFMNVLPVMVVIMLIGIIKPIATKKITIARATSFLNSIHTIPPAAKYYKVTLLTLLFHSIILCVISSAATLQINANEESPFISFSISVKQADQLAGVKLVLEYPKESLLLKAALKNESFNSFMHVVNDKRPGHLVLVMASAEGVSGEILELFNLRFNSTDQITSPYGLLKVIDCQLMSETLAEIPCNLPSPNVLSTPLSQ